LIINSRIAKLKDRIYMKFTRIALTPPHTFLFLIVLISGLLTCTPAYSQNKPDDEFTLTLKTADEFYSAKDYPHALEAYTKAFNLKPGQQQVKERIDEINNIISEKAQNISFEDNILEGEKAFKSKDYPSAKRFFENALNIDPTAQYPKDRLSEIRSLYSDPADLARFNEAMAKGNQELSASNYPKARNWFEIALSAQPGSRLAKDKLAESNRLNTEYQAKKLQFDQLMASGEKQLQQEKRTEARVLFQQASDLLPYETSARQKIQEIDNWLNQKKSIQDSFDKAIELADQFYINRDFTNARLKYEEAIRIKPDARYPKDMIEKSKTGESTSESLKEKYDATIASADNFYTSGDLEAALLGYKSALEILPGSSYPQSKITLIETAQAERSSRKEAFDIALRNGDQAFAEKKYDQALGHFRNALTLFPEEKYPKDKIDEIILLRGEQEKYETLLATGDKAYSEKKYSLAITSYQEASQLKPAEQYPVDKITAINLIMKDEAARQEMYAQAITTADKLLSEKQYDRALAAYNEANSIKSDEKYPQQKVKEINILLENSRKSEANYSRLIADGDSLYDQKQYPEAINSFQAALKQKPAEEYPKSKVIAINKLLADQKQLDDSYIKSISDADKAFGMKNYPGSLTAYQQALTLKPGEKYPQDKINEINDIVSTLADQKVRQESYDKAIAEGDKKLSEKSFNDAIDSYTSALSYKPDESYPKGKIAEINLIVNGIKATGEKYAKAIEQGDAAFAKQDYNAAQDAYNEALKVKPGEKYPTDKLNSVLSILADLKAKDDAYNKAISTADELFNAKDYDASVTAYRQATVIKPGEKYPNDQISAANAQLADQKAKQDLYDKSIADGDKSLALKNYTEALTAYKQALIAKPAEIYPTQKINEINTVMAASKAMDESYSKAIADGDGFFNVKKYREALEPYERASTIKPEETYPKQQKEKISLALAEQKKLDDGFNKLIADADKLFNEKKYQASLSIFESAHDLKTEEPYPVEKIKAIQDILAEMQVRDESYNKALAEGDAHLASKDLAGALLSFNNALIIKPGEAYPTEKVNSIKAELKGIDEKYNRILADGDSKLEAHNFSEALNLYQQSLDIKPGEKYPKEKIAEINERLVQEKAEQDRLYNSTVAEGDQFLSAQNYVDAKRAYVKASGIKPSEKYPKDKLIEINLVLDARSKAVKDEYNKAIVDADRLYQQKVLDQAIEAYELAASIKPDETYPGEMVRKIQQYIADHSILDVNSSTVVIPAGDEHKFSFKGIEPRLRSNNYVMIRARAIGTTVPKVYFNYGRDNAKNGGIVLRTISNKEGIDYLIRLTGQDKWYREDNNWLSLYTEGCDIEISKIQISQGE
jgi:tetratricopeptide (TPR) repeat protein